MGSATKDITQFKEEINDPSNLEEVDNLPWTTDQEILLLYSLQGYKPVGLHKHARMLVIQDRFSNALNKNVSCQAIWKKLNTLYDLEALDEAEAEADATVAVETNFSLPEDEMGDMMRAKISGRLIKVEKLDYDYSDSQIGEMTSEIKTEPGYGDQENKSVDNTLDLTKGGTLTKDGKKEILKKGPKKKDLTPTKENANIKKENTKETPKKEIQNKKETVKEPKKGGAKEEEKKDVGKKSIEGKKDNVKEDKKEISNKINKRDSADKKITEQVKKELELKKLDQKKSVDVQKSQRVEPAKARSETPKQMRNETPKRAEPKILRSETPKPQKAESPLKPQRVEMLRKESGTDKKKETDKKTEIKSPEKSPDTKGAKLRTRGKEAESEKSETPTTATKRERSRDSTSKSNETPSDEPAAKKSKILTPKGRPTRNSIEPQPKPASPTVSVAKRRTRQ